MKTGQFSKTIALILAIQMALAPLAHAQSLGALVGSVTSLAQGFLNGAQQANLQQQAQLIAQQRAQALDPTVCNGAQCRSPIFPNCRILVARPNIIDQSICKEPGLDPSNPNDVNRLPELLAAVNNYTQLENIYTTFGVNTPQNTDEGVACLNQSATALEQALRKREEEIDKLVTDLTNAQKNFTTLLAPVRADIEEAQSLLLGASFRGNKSKLNAKGDLYFSDKFDDPRCKAVLMTPNFNTEGKARGLQGIENRLQTIVTSKRGDPNAPAGSFSAEGFNQSTVSSLQESINNIGNLIGREVRNGAAITTSLADGVNDVYGLVANQSLVPNILKEVNRDDTAFRQGLTQRVRDFTTTATQNNAIQASLFGVNDADFEQALFDFETGFKNGCLTSANSNVSKLLAGGIPMRRRGVQQSSATNAAANSFIENLRAILSDPNVSIDDKKRAILAEEKKNSNNLYFLELSQPLPIQNEDGSWDTIKVSGISPVDFINKHINNCNGQFNARIGNKPSRSKAMAQYRDTRKAYKKHLDGLPTKINNALKDRLINCASSERANAQANGSCSMNDLSTQSATFCIKRAAACATNMNSCFDKARKKVADITSKRDQKIAQYKTNVDRNKAALTAMYRRLDLTLKIQGFNLANSPLKEDLILPPGGDLTFDFNKVRDSRNFVLGLEDLDVEDPDAYFNLMKKNLADVKKALEEQREKIMNGGDTSVRSDLAKGVNGHIQQIEKNMNDAKALAARNKQECERAQRRYANEEKRFIAEQTAAQNEAMKATRDLCNAYESVGASPSCDQLDTITSSLEAARQAGSGSSGEARVLAQFEGYCKRSQREAEAAPASSVPTSQRRRAVDSQCRTSPDGNCQVYLATQYCLSRRDKVTTTDGVVALPTPFSLEREQYEAITTILGIEKDKCGDWVRGSNLTLNCVKEIEEKIKDNSKMNEICDANEPGSRRDGLVDDIFADLSTTTGGNPDRDDARWRELTSGLGERGGNCTAQDNSQSQNPFDSLSRALGGNPLAPGVSGER